MNVGISIGGPAAGRELYSKCETIVIPVKTGTGHAGYSPAIYKWLDGKWTYQEPRT